MATEGFNETAGTGPAENDDADTKIVAAQLGRGLRAKSEVAARCALGLPTVVTVPSFLDNNEPFPTRYWLSCPLAHRRISRLESQGRIVELQNELEENAELRAAFDCPQPRLCERTRD